MPRQHGLGATLVSGRARHHARVFSAAAGPDADATALAARMISPPTGADFTALSNYFAGLKTDGVYALTNQLLVFPSVSTEPDDSLLDFTGRFDAVTVGTPSYDTTTGWTTNGTTSAIDCIIAATTAALTSQNDISIAVWLTDTGQFTTNVIGAATDASMRLNPRTTSDLITFRTQTGGGTSTATVATAAGLTHFNRTGASTQQVFRNGVQVGADTAGTSASPTAVPFNLGRSNTVFTAGTFLVFAVMRTVTPTQALAFYNRTNTYLTAIGAI